MLAAWAIFPLLLLATCLGVGLFVERLSGQRLPGALLAPLGMAAISVLGLATTAFASVASWTAPLMALCAVAGFALAVRSGRALRPDPWALVLASLVFATFAAPVVLSGDPTFAGYIKLDDTATWFAITDRLMEHGRDISSLPPSSYEATLYYNLAGWYPVGAFVPLGVGAKLSGEELAWVFQPYLSLLASFTALSLWQLVQKVRLPRALKFVAVLIAAQAALLFSYAMWGGIKELATAALIGLIAALAVVVIEGTGRSVRGLLPLATAAGALVGLVSFGAGPWLLGLLGATAFLALHRWGLRGLLEVGWRFVVVFVPVVGIGLIGHPLLPDSTKFLLSASTDLGNLAGPISPAHLLGIWPAHDFREAIDAAVFSGALIALAAVAAATGAWAAWKERDKGLLVALGGAVVGCALIAIFGSAWVAAKSYAIVSPFALLFAFLGLGFISRLGGQIVAALVAILLCVGVVWSNALVYGGVSLGPRDQLGELGEIGRRFDGVEPALMTEYQPYGVRHFLRDMAPEGASELRRRPVYLRDGTTLEKGEQADIDRFSTSSVFTYRALVLRRSPAASRPPAAYRLAWQGRYYDVWVRPARATVPLEHLELGSEVDPAAVPRCSDVLRLAQHAAVMDGSLAAAADASHPIAYALSGALISGGIARSPLGKTYLQPLGREGRFALPIAVPKAGSYKIWLGGSLRPDAKVFVDNDEVGSLRQQLNAPGNYLDFGTIRLTAGRHTVSMMVGGPDLHPGSAGTDGPLGPLVLSRSAKLPPLRFVSPERARSLCGKQWDWIEALQAR